MLKTPKSFEISKRTLILGLEILGTALGLSLSAQAAVRPTRDPFPLSLANSLFENGRQPNPSELIGTWINVGEVTLPRKIAFFPLQGYDPKGIRNSDWTNRARLDFRAGPSGRTDFAGNPLKYPLEAILSNLGSRWNDQDALEVSFPGNAPEARFSQRAYFDPHKCAQLSDDYSPATTPLLRSRFDYECRLLPSDSRKMICRISFAAEPAEVMHGALPDSDGPVYIFAYVKKER